MRAKGTPSPVALVGGARVEQVAVEEDAVSRVHLHVDPGKELLHVLHTLRVSNGLVTLPNVGEATSPLRALEKL